MYFGNGDETLRFMQLLDGGRTAVVALKTDLVFVDVATQTVTRRVPFRPGTLVDLTIDEAGVVFAVQGAGRNEYECYSLSTGKEVWSGPITDPHPLRVHRVLMQISPDLSPDEAWCRHRGLTYVCVDSARLLAIWRRATYDSDLEKLSEVVLPPNTSFSYSVLSADESRIAMVAYDNNTTGTFVVVANTATGKIVYRRDYHVRYIALSDDGRFLFCTVWHGAYSIAVIDVGTSEIAALIQRAGNGDITVCGSTLMTSLAGHASVLFYDAFRAPRELILATMGDRHWMRLARADGDGAIFSRVLSFLEWDMPTS